ncbi:DUF2802 domain-containing protein [Oceanospirillum linum]|uniref:DUF2802 domain-containing protein n=1 Tax=Oceanospirillum linum TaxID=966 RepID=A0A1T1HFH2_OCELI|nr:DUF2802 domain-containing protein [Oceanospirillum linum]OOV88555.1 hypothetical protein BTA35_0203405 [Oceanospirillum linum]SEF60655.1 Protein of unknown function [Oleiphilus messinensis]SMP06983.1 Protein of unknown function [Oceanospirillum linum]
MQDSLANLILWATVIIAVLVAVYGVMQVMTLRRLLDRSKHETQMLVQSLRNETHAMGSGSIGVGQRLLEVEKKLNQTMERQVDLEQKDAGSLPYNYAIRLVEMGASADDLVENCGLARVEADLIALVHAELKKRHQNDISYDNF